MNFNHFCNLMRYDFNVKGIIIFLGDKTILVAGYPYVRIGADNDNEAKP